MSAFGEARADEIATAIHRLGKANFFDIKNAMQNSLAFIQIAMSYIEEDVEINVAANHTIGLMDVFAGKLVRYGEMSFQHKTELEADRHAALDAIKNFQSLVIAKAQPNSFAIAMGF